MSSYFDQLSREVRDAADQHVEESTDNLFLDAVQAIEERMYRDVTQVTGDREFPEDLREQILTALAVHGIYQPGFVPVPERARQTTLVTGISNAIEEVHSLFHEVARRGIDTRFGRLSDSPTHILALREDYEETLRRAVQG